MTLIGPQIAPFWIGAMTVFATFKNIAFDLINGHESGMFENIRLILGTESLMHNVLSNGVLSYC